MIRKIPSTGSYSWSTGTANAPHGIFDSSSWLESNQNSGNWNFNRGWAKSWVFNWSWCWLWTETDDMPWPTSELWGGYK